MSKKFLGLLVLVLAVMGIFALSSGRPKPVGPDQHNMKLIVVALINDVSTEKILKITTTADVTVPSLTQPGKYEHGINQDTHLPYPSVWSGYAPQQADINYTAQRDPTSFYLHAEIPAARVRGLMINGKNAIRSTVVAMTCRFVRDGKDIDIGEIAGRTYDDMTISDAINRNSTGILQITCRWVDRSRS